ncbi:hypothetical protein ACFE04_026811 [Oxalis oulophora]
MDKGRRGGWRMSNITYSHYISIYLIYSYFLGRQNMRIIRFSILSFFRCFVFILSAFVYELILGERESVKYKWNSTLCTEASNSGEDTKRRRDAGYDQVLNVLSKEKITHKKTFTAQHECFPSLTENFFTVGAVCVAVHIGQKFTAKVFSQVVCCGSS